MSITFVPCYFLLLVVFCFFNISSGIIFDLYDLSRWIPDPTKSFSQFSSNLTTLTISSTSRIYLLQDESSNLESITPVSKSIDFDVDISKVPCGWGLTISLIKLSSIEQFCNANGGDDGKSKCPEFNLLMANNGGYLYASRPCNTQGCYGGEFTRLSPNSVNLHQPFHVHTEFTNENTIVQKYTQNGRVYEARLNTDGAFGGIPQMYRNMQTGMNLVVSLFKANTNGWIDNGCQPNTLDADVKAVMSWFRYLK